jgi:DNA-binding winged helix-turn-helix (wHTH) protein
MPNAFQIPNFERQHDCLVLTRALKFFSVVHVTGLEGVGKTTLIRDFLAQNQLTNFWISLSNSFTIQEITEEISQQSEQVIICDNLHYLSKANQQKIIFSAIQNLTQKKTIFISNEVIEPINNEPIVKISGLSREQCLDFFKYYETDYTDKQVQKIFDRTGGLIGQLKLCLIDPGASGVADPYLKPLSQMARQTIKLIAASTLDLIESELDVPAIDELRRRFLVTIEEGGRLQCPQFLKTAIREALSKDELQQKSKDASRIILARADTPTPIRLFCALESLDLDQAIKIAENVSLNEIEEFSPTHINRLVVLLEVHSPHFSSNKCWMLARIYIHVLILSNRRAEAISVCRLLLDKTDWDLFGEESFLLAYDVIYWLNRSASVRDIEVKRNKMTNLAKRPLLYLFQIEQCFVQAQQSKSTKDAITTLNRIKSEIVKSTATAPDYTNILSLAQGNCLFQMGIQYIELQEYVEALSAFENAQHFFEKIGRKYLELFSEFNCCFILFYQNKIQELQERLRNLKLKAQLNGYPYLQSGVSLLMADCYFSNLDPSKALIEIEEAIARTDDGMPVNSKAAIAAAKIRIVNELGLSDLTHSLYQQFVNNFEKQMPVLAKTLGLETQIKFKPANEVLDWLESEDGGEHEGNHLEIYLLQRGINPGDQFLQKFESGSLREILANLEYNLIKAIKLGEKSEAESAARELLGTLNITKEVLPQKIAGELILLSISSENKTIPIERLKTQIEISKSTPDEREFFYEWLRAIEVQHDLSNIKRSGKYSEALLERWSLWIPENRAKKYSLLTNEGTTSLDTIPSKLPNAEVFLNENQKEVFLNKKIVSDFTKKPILIQILAILMNSAPEHVSKSSLATLLWTERYDPDLHDKRIYTSIQRIRSIMGEKYVDNWKGGYRWAPKVTYALLRTSESTGFKQNRMQNIFLEIIRARSLGGIDKDRWISKKELVEITETSEATAKRTLAALLQEGLIERSGSGSHVVYMLSRKV